MNILFYIHGCHSTTPEETVLHSFCTLYNFVRNRNIWCFSTLSVHNIYRYYTACPFRFPAFVTDLLLRSVPVTPRQIRENAPRITDVGLTVEHLHTYPNIFIRYGKFTFQRLGGTCQTVQYSSRRFLVYPSCFLPLSSSLP